MSKRDSVYIPLNVAFKILYNLADIIEERRKRELLSNTLEESFKDLAYLLYPYTETEKFRIIPKI